MKKLPKLFKNENIKVINHNKKACKVTEEKDLSVRETLEEIFNGEGHPYNIRVEIKTRRSTFETFLIAKNNDKVITLDNKTLRIEDVTSIKIKK